VHQERSTRGHFPSATLTFPMQSVYVWPVLFLFFVIVADSAVNTLEETRTEPRRRPSSAGEIYLKWTPPHPHPGPVFFAFQDFDVDEYVKRMGYDRERDIDKVREVSAHSEGGEGGGAARRRRNRQK